MNSDLNTEWFCLIAGMLHRKGVGRASIWKEINDVRAVLQVSVRSPELLSACKKRWMPILKADSHSIEAMERALQVIETGEFVVTFAHEHYPITLSRRLKRMAPLFFVCGGNTSLLTETAIGFCGSRKSSESSASLAYQCAESLAELGLVVVAGNARGIDKTAHVAALEAGGSTVLVLPEGYPSRAANWVSHYGDSKRVLVVSEFFPWDKWTVARAMQRNWTITGLSEAIIVVQAGLPSGSYEAGLAALEQGTPCFTIQMEEYPSEYKGNEELLRKGAVPLRTSGSELDSQSFKNLMASSEPLWRFYRTDDAQPNLFED